MQLYAVNAAKTVIVSSRVNLFSASPCNADINLPEHTLLFGVKTFTVSETQTSLPPAAAPQAPTRAAAPWGLVTSLPF